MSTSSGGATSVVTVTPSPPPEEDGEAFLKRQLEQERKDKEQLVQQLRRLQDEAGTKALARNPRGFRRHRRNTARQGQPAVQVPEDLSTLMEQSEEGIDPQPAPEVTPEQGLLPAASGKRPLRNVLLWVAIFATGSALLVYGLTLSFEESALTAVLKLVMVMLGICLILTAVVAIAGNNYGKQPPEWVFAGRPIKPGPRRVLWWLWVRMGLYNFTFIPHPRPHGVYIARTVAIWRFVRDNRKSLMAIVDVLNLKGGAGKTTVATYFAAALNLALGISQVFLLDLDHAMSKVIGRFNQPNKFSGKRITVKGALHLVTTTPDKIDGHYLVENTMSDNVTGVMFFGGTSEKESFPHAPVIALIKKLASLVHTVVVDNRPSLSDPSITASVKASDIRIIPAEYSSEEHLTDVERTLGREGFDLSAKHLVPNPDNPDDPDSLTVVIDRADESVIVVLYGVPRRKFNTRTQYEMAERFGLGHDPERLVLWPYSRQMKRAHVSLLRLTPRALFSVYKLVSVHARLVLEKKLAAPLSIPPTTNQPEQPAEQGEQS